MNADIAITPIRLRYVPQRRMTIQIAGTIAACLSGLLISVLPAAGAETLPTSLMGIYEYVYPYNTERLIENHYIELVRENGRIAGRYYGTSDDFDKAREGYLPGFFSAEMTDLVVTGTTIGFTVEVGDADLVSEPVTPFNRTPRAATWDIGLRYHRRVYRGRFAGDDLVIHTDGFEPRVFRRVVDDLP